MCPKKQVRSTNPNLVSLIRFLKKKSRENNVGIWRDVANKISRPKKTRISVIVSKINRLTKENEIVIVPGKVLGSGMIEHTLTVAALDFSDQAQAKIVEAKGKCLTLQEIVEENPKGTNIRIIG
ncbi:50S ribosomal protein L18e [Candidatus Bathyarchaeota archaeon]|nr:50S ribosomal protein L18e [Candidatus Bathyarchaeota archaeon]